MKREEHYTQTQSSILLEFRTRITCNDLGSLELLDLNFSPFKCLLTARQNAPVSFENLNRIASNKTFECLQVSVLQIMF